MAGGVVHKRSICKGYGLRYEACEKTQHSPIGERGCHYILAEGVKVRVAKVQGRRTEALEAGSAGATGQQAVI